LVAICFVASGLRVIRRAGAPPAAKHETTGHENTKTRNYDPNVFRAFVAISFVASWRVIRLAGAPRATKTRNTRPRKRETRETTRHEKTTGHETRKRETP
jgi:hypothetical protein